MKPKQIKVCECCGFPLPPELPEGANFTDTEARVFDIIRKAGKAGIKKIKIHDELYGHRSDGGPDSINVVDVYVWKIRRKIWPLGMDIINGFGKRDFPPGYQLVERTEEFPDNMKKQR